MNQYPNETGQVEFIECHFCKRHTPKPRARTTTIIYPGDPEDRETEVLTCRNCNIIAHNVFSNNLFVVRALCSVTRLLWEKTSREAERVIRSFREYNDDLEYDDME